MRKIILVYKDIVGNIAEESVWAEPKDDYFEIKNIPFFAPNIAMDDIVSIEQDEDELYFDSLVNSSGNSTIQIVLFIEKEKDRIIQGIEILGCGWEGMHNQMYLAVNIPSELDYSKVKRFLEEEVKKLVLDYKEACISYSHTPKYF